MDSLAPPRLLPALVLALAACSPAAPPPPPIAVEAPMPELASWEREFSPSDLVAYRTGRVIEARVHDEERHVQAPDTPIAGARVDLLAPRPGGSGALTVVASAESDADGRFLVGPGPPNNWVLRVVKDGYTPTVGGRGASRSGVVLVPAGGDVTMMLRPAVERSGTLVDESGAPLPDEPVSAFGEAYREEVRTAPDGRFVIHPPAAPILIEPLGEGFLREQARIDAASVAPIEVRAVRRGVIRGSVVELETGRPLAGAVVTWDGEPQLGTRTDARGRFEIPEPRARPLGPGVEGRLAAFARGWGWRSIELPVAGEVELRLQAGTGAAGRVVDGAGRPVAGARIYGLSVSWDRVAERIHGPLTAADGSFALDWLPRPPRGARERVMLLAYRRGQGASEALEAPGDGSPVTLVLPGERVVRGRITRESGVGIPGLSLELSWSEWGLWGAAAARLPFDAAVDGGTAGDGSFELYGVPLDREATLRAFLDGGRLDTVLPPGDTADVPIVLEGGGVVTGRVFDVEGEPLAVSGTVTAFSTDHEVFTRIERRTALVDGVFRLEDLPDARYSVSADVDGMIVRSCSASVGDDVRLVASRLGRLVVRTVFPGDAEPEPIVVRFARAETSMSSARRMEVPADTCTAARPVQAGVFDLEASGGVWRAAVDGVRVDDGEEKVVELRLERTLRVRGRLLEQDGTPIPGGRVRFFALDDPRRKPEVYHTDADGWLDVTGLTRGTWEARAVLADRAPLRVVVPTDPLPETLELRLPPHGTLQIDVRTDSGEPAGGALVDLALPDGSPLDAWGEGARQLGSLFRADADGRVVVRGVRAGPAVVRARQAGRDELGRAEVDVQPGETVQVTIN